jgi:hypothetical protein
VTDLRTIQTENRRLEILRLLATDRGYASNDALIQDGLAVYGLNASRDQIRADIVWLAEQDLLSYESLSGLYTATIKMRGYDVAKGNTQVPGVARPRPE